MVADRRDEAVVEPWVGRDEGDQASAWADLLFNVLALWHVVDDVLEDVEADGGVQGKEFAESFNGDKITLEDFEGLGIGDRSRSLPTKLSMRDDAGADVKKGVTNFGDPVKKGVTKVAGDGEVHSGPLVYERNERRWNR